MCNNNINIIINEDHDHAVANIALSFKSQNLINFSYWIKSIVLQLKSQAGSSSIGSVRDELSPWILFFPWHLD